MKPKPRRVRTKAIPRDLAVVLRHLAAICHVPREEMDDLVQDVWLRIQPKLDDFYARHGIDAVQRWLYRVVHDQAIDYVRKKARHRVRPLSAAFEARLVAREAEPEQVMEARERHELARRLLDQIRTHLPEASFRILELVYLDGRSITEVAQEIGLSAREVRYRKYRAIKKMRRLLGGGGLSRRGGAQKPNKKKREKRATRRLGRRY